MSDDETRGDNQPRARVTRIFEDMRQGAAAARRQRWTIISAAAVDIQATCDDAGCDCMSVLPYRPSDQRRETDN